MPVGDKRRKYHGPAGGSITDIKSGKPAWRLGDLAAKALGSAPSCTYRCHRCHGEAGAYQEIFFMTELRLSLDNKAASGAIYHGYQTPDTIKINNHL